MSLSTIPNPYANLRLQNKELYEHQKPLFTMTMGKREVNVINEFDVLRGVEPDTDEDVFKVVFTSSPRENKPARYAKDAADVRAFIASKCGCSMTNIFSFYCNGIFNEDFVVKP